MTVQLGSYVRSHYKHRDPGKNNLLLIPSHTNCRGKYEEGVSAEMWLGERFWQYAACSKGDVLSADWLKCEDRGHHMHLEAWPEPFTSAEGEQGKIQRRLLGLLFGIRESPPPLPGSTPPPLPATPPPLPIADGPDPENFLEGIREFAQGDLNGLETLIVQTKAGVADQETLVRKLMGSECYILTRSADTPDACARLRNPDSGEPMLVVLSSWRLAEKAIRERPSSSYSHIQPLPFSDVLGVCKNALGIVLNPLDDHLLIEFSIEQIREIKKLLS